MFVRPEQLVEALSAGPHGGDPFECFVKDLVWAEARLHGLAITDIDRDFRTNCADGGCDLFVRKGHGDTSPRFLPNAPSMWSIKGGKNGVQTSTLQKEITTHQRIIDHMKGGGVYVWCALQAIEQGQRAEMQAKVNELAQVHGFPADRVVFVWLESLQTIVELHPNLVAKHLPNVPLNSDGVFTLGQWYAQNPEKFGYQVPWVDFDCRDQVKARVRDHLLASSGSPVLHLAGISGIGKTRTVLEACRGHDKLQCVLYAPQRSQVSEQFLRQIAQDGFSVALVIDEVDLTEYSQLAGRFTDLGARLRIVTIGPARRDENTRGADPNILVLPEPTTTEAVLQVLQSAPSGLSGAVLADIAGKSGNDLRLALLLLDATVRDPSSSAIPLRDLDGIWTRVSRLFSTHLGDVGQFRRQYGVLTLGIDIGICGKHSSELDFVSCHFTEPKPELLRTITDACQVGLGSQPSDFFEAGPRALAIHFFGDQLWPVLKLDLDRFVEHLPTDRLRRRFLERCQELRGSLREEVMDRVSGFFCRKLGDGSLVAITDREASRVFQAWAEFDPNRGLEWLLRAVERATHEQLAAFDGAPDGSGGWRGRRQIVWVLEHLAAFGEYFHTCEQILFRLSQVETEKEIGNNSTGIWKCMFLPVLSNTEVPFEPRFGILLGRLQHATTDNVLLILSAGIEILRGDVSRMVPPSVVGGRIVPAQWQPGTTGELRKLRQDAGRRLVAGVASLSQPVKRLALDFVIEHLRTFLDRGLVAEVQAALCWEGVSAPQIRKLRAALDEIIGMETLVAKKGNAKPRVDLEALRQWRDSLKPENPKEQIIDFTSREYWSFYRTKRWGDDGEAAEEVFRELATQLLAVPQLLHEIKEWLRNDECRSGGTLGFETGQKDAECLFLQTILVWFEEGWTTDFAFKYFRGLSLRQGELPGVARATLDRVATKDPITAVRATLDADFSDAGWSRLLACFPLVPPDRVHLYAYLGHGPWAERLTTVDKERMLELLVEHAERTESRSLWVALELLHFWTGSGQVQPALRAIALRVWAEASKVEASTVVEYAWTWLGEQLLAPYPVEIVQTAARIMTDVESSNYYRRESAEKLLNKGASACPNQAMEALGSLILNERLYPIFRVFVFRGIFDTIGLPAVQEWVKHRGVREVAAIARHLNGPSVGEDGSPIIPAVADWLLSEYGDHEDIFREFLMGQHSHGVMVGLARDRKSELTAMLDRFRHIERPWVQKWIRCEEEEMRQEIERQSKWEDERMRT